MNNFQLPTPKYKIGDRVWIVDFDKVIQVEITGIYIQADWFDNNYTSRLESTIKYDITERWGPRLEECLYSSEKEASIEMNKCLDEFTRSQIKSLQEDFFYITTRCQKLNISLDSLISTNEK